MSPLAKVMVLISRPADGALLVQSDTDGDGDPFERPLGGHIEFSERSAVAARREIIEEIGQEIENLRLLEVIENLFTLDGVAGHEIVFLYQADFVDAAAYDIEEQVVRDEPTVRVRWRGPDEQTPRLVPGGISPYL